MISKMHPYAEGDEDRPGSKIAIVFNGSPLFSGDAGSGPSNIRRWIIENDWLDAIVALPDQLFYNTSIFTYVWLVTNRKPPERRGKVQLIDGTRFFQKMKKSLINKRNEITEEQISHLTRVYGNYQDHETAPSRSRCRSTARPRPASSPASSRIGNSASSRSRSNAPWG
jgi:type I restriction enzyme M protein